MSLKLSKEIKTVTKIHLGMSIILFIVCLCAIFAFSNPIHYLVVTLTTVAFWSYTWGWLIGLKVLKKEYIDLMKKGLE